MWDVIAEFLGELIGIAIALVLITLWIGTAGPIQEWATEKYIDRGRGKVRKTNAAAAEVLVSDLHIDTWDYPSEPSGRAKSFPEFLEAVRQEPSLQGFILNGDLMDIPLFAGGPQASQDPLTLYVDANTLPDDGVLASRYDEVLGKLLELEHPGPGGPGGKSAGVRRAIFQTGNHDIGVCGLRYSRQRMPPFLPPVRISWSPQILLQHGPEEGQKYAQATYIEHGHHYDPLLWLYLRYAVLDILRGGQIDYEQKLAGGFQRRGRIGMGPSARRTGWAAQWGSDAPPNGEHPADPAPATLQDWDFDNRQLSLLEKLVIYRFRQAARRAFRQLRAAGNKPPVGTVTFGHIHIPDRYVFPNGDVYINSGDWCGLTSHQCYCVVHQDGTVRGPFQWENAARFQKTLRPTAEG